MLLKKVVKKNQEQKIYIPVLTIKAKNQERDCTHTSF